MHRLPQLQGCGKRAESGEAGIGSKVRGDDGGAAAGAWDGVRIQVFADGYVCVLGGVDVFRLRDPQRRRRLAVRRVPHSARITNQAGTVRVGIVHAYRPDPPAA
jgi:hypothetical protein